VPIGRSLRQTWGGNIIEICHHRLFQDVSIKLAELGAVIETRNAQHVDESIRALDAAGFKFRLLGQTELEGRTV